MIYCKAIALLVLFALLSMISTLRFTKRAPSFASKFGKMVRSSTAANATPATVFHPSFEEMEQFSVNEYNLRGVLYKHRKTGAEVISIQAPDHNKVFGITFRTPPKDSTGVPHILEHSVLCGSRKFPVKEPFVDMLRGSLQNFLNAFTYPDRTCYPVASTNTKDFYNLVHVYLDAVLHPRAVRDPQVLQQEGWHYELDGDDPAGALSIKGVVFNEMKGVYSSPESLLGRATQQALFPDNAYAVDSGGDPEKIPDLTFEQFRAFHAQYYHPSNSRIFFYGDDDAAERLKVLDEYLREFDAAPAAAAASAVQYQPKLPQPRRVEAAFPISEGAEAKHMITVNWVLNHAPLLPKDGLALAVLNHLLIGTSSAPLKKALIESNLGESLVGYGLGSELIQSTYGVGLRGVQADNTGKVETLVHSTLARLSKDGFDAADVQAAVNTIEFQLREFNSGGFPKGLAVMLGIVPSWIYGRPLLEGVRFEEPLQQLKDELARGVPVFQDLLQRYFVRNTHQVTVEMRPDAKLEQNRLAEEAALLGRIKAGMSEEQLRDVVESAVKLREAQEAPDSSEARATLPRLALSDIDPVANELPIQVVDDATLRAAGIQEATVLKHDLSTSGILYADVAFDYSGIEADDLELLPLFAKMLMESGTTKYDLATLTRKIGTSTGGITVTLHNDLKVTGNKVVNGDETVLYLVLRGKAVRENVGILFQLFSDIVLTADLSNQKRAVELLKESKARKEAKVISAGHSFAAIRLASRHSLLGHVREVTEGITSVRSASTLLQRATTDWAGVEARLQRMRSAILKKGKGAMVVNLTGDSALMEGAMPAVKTFVDALPPSAGVVRATHNSVVGSWKPAEKVAPVSEAFLIPSQVNYVGMGGPILSPGSEVKGSYEVAARHLSTGYLWDQVRVVGGAYGGFGRFSAVTGRFSFLSYRDPNCLDTLQVYDGAAEALGNAELTSEDILQAVIGTVGDLDAPMSPDAKGFASLGEYLRGETAQDRQQKRTEILATSDADFRTFAEALSRLKETGSVAVLGAQPAVEAANAKLPEHRRMVVEPAILSTPQQSKD